MCSCTSEVANSSVFASQTALINCMQLLREQRVQPPRSCARHEDKLPLTAMLSACGVMADSDSRVEVHASPHKEHKDYSWFC